jgi:hypothetical protein
MPPLLLPRIEDNKKEPVMGLSTNTTVFTGGSQNFVVNFALGFLSRSDVKVRVNGALDGAGNPSYAQFTWIDDSNITVNDTLTVGDFVEVLRTVSKTSLAANFTANTDVTPANLDISAKQGLMVYQELIDGRVEGTESPIVAADRAVAAAASASASAASAAGSAALTAADRAQTAADRVVTTQDALDTAADVVTTNASKVAAAASAAAASSSATASAASAGISTTQAAASSASAAAAAASAAAAVVSASGAASSATSSATSATSSAASAAQAVNAAIIYSIALG